jgi:peptidoglycan/xylan/chitin deacetylase (PgdA/CDA1 family)
MFRLPSLIRLRSAGAILSFHGVSSPDMPGESVVHVSLDTLAAIIALARDAGELVPLRELVRRHQAGRSTAGLIAVTMDDAYASLLSVAHDFLAREAVPLTVFVVRGAATTGAAFWWDRVDDLFPYVSRDRWRAFEHACGVPDAYRRGQPGQFGPSRPLRQWILASYAGRWPQALEPALRALEEETGIRTVQRSMTFEELDRFRRLPSVDVGVHTVSHPVLPLLDDAELQDEIAGAHDALREHVPDAVPILAIPFGLFDHRTVVAARECGMVASLTLAERTLRAHRDRNHLPRFCISREGRVAKLRVRLTGLMDRRPWWRWSARPSYPALPSPTT